jgi:hypothetical protein
MLTKRLQTTRLAARTEDPCRAVFVPAIVTLMQAFGVVVALSAPGGGPIPCGTGFAVAATVTFSVYTASGSLLSAEQNVSLTCVPFAPTSPYRFTFLDEGDGSVQVGATVPYCGVFVWARYHAFSQQWLS